MRFEICQNKQTKNNCFHKKINEKRENQRKKMKEKNYQRNYTVHGLLCMKGKKTFWLKNKDGGAGGGVGAVQEAWK